MWVELEFDLGGQRYRIWRQRSKRGPGQSDLHFYVWNASSDEWQLLDEGGLRERQAQITRLLRMEYETFTNSAFLLQGKADSFTIKTASERKQILADILGLSRFDLYEERAKEEMQARKDQVAQIQGEIRAIDQDLARRDEYEAHLQAARDTAAEAVRTLRTAEAEQSRWRQAVQERQTQIRQLHDLQERLARAEHDLVEVKQQLASEQARLARFEGVLAEREQIEAGWTALRRARDEDAAWNERLVRSLQLQESLNRAQLAVEQVRLKVEADRRRLADRAEELAPKVVAGQEQARILSQLQEVLAQMAAHEARRDIIGAELRELVERSSALRTDSERLKQEGQAAREKIDMLGDAESAACPLCGQPLEPEHRDRMLADLRAERDALADRYGGNAAELRTLSERKMALEAEEGELVRALRAKDARQRQAAQAEAVVGEGKLAEQERLQLAEQIAQLDARLVDGDYAAAERAELARRQAELDGVGYDSVAHEEIRARLVELEPFDERYRRELLPALDGVGDARTRVDSLAAQLSRREVELTGDRVERDHLAAAVADLPELEAALTRATRAVDEAAAKERRAHQEEGAAMQQLDALAAQANKRAQRLVEMASINEGIGIYSQLREAFGKKGLQAMIIESAIPEVEVEANRLLNRMSEGRMSLRLETQREKVTGGLAETLDIIISDELGARAYETYSGGEAFRANLALRIALSKLLARRAGAQLQTLVIDEGFGTQDTQGRQMLVEAINSIQGDFERIIVITHIEELKDLFPARIDVVKTASGSTVSVA
jgi:exonuclease SbcC